QIRFWTSKYDADTSDAAERQSNKAWGFNKPQVGRDKGLRPEGAQES
ncbi:MAG: hypothetical protein GY795_47560, partial [Desulfobacterales bacterium]|nr:hypothetical protein [Desulfobacterales bacterium]